MPSIRNVRLFIKHKQVIVNGRFVTNKKFQLKKGDLIEPRSQGCWIQLVAATKSKGDPFKADFDRLLLLDYGFSNL